MFGPNFLRPQGMCQKEARYLNHVRVISTQVQLDQVSGRRFIALELRHWKRHGAVHLFTPLHLGVSSDQRIPQKSSTNIYQPIWQHHCLHNLSFCLKTMWFFIIIVVWSNSGENESPVQISHQTNFVHVFWSNYDHWIDMDE